MTYHVFISLGYIDQYIKLVTPIVDTLLDMVVTRLFFKTKTFNRRTERGKQIWAHRPWPPGAGRSSVERAFAHGAMGRRIDPSWGGPIELFLVPASAPRLV